MPKIQVQGNAGVLGTGSCLPERRVSSKEVADLIGVDVRWIAERIGVRERRFAAAGETATTLAAGAATGALAMAGLAADELDAVVVATSTPDRPIPGVAALLQATIGAQRALAFDVNASCAGFLFALETARGLLAADPHRRYVLVAAADTYSHYLNPADRRTYPLFGDGSGAVVLGRVPAGEGILTTELKTDGRLEKFATGGPRLPLAAEQLAAGGHYIIMSGRDVANLVLSEFPRLINDTVKEQGITLRELDHVICHQANPRLLESCARTVALTPDQLVITGDMVANTASASVPIGLDVAVRDGRIRPGDAILMITFGAGMSWGRTFMRWPSPTAVTDEKATKENAWN